MLISQRKKVHSKNQNNECGNYIWNSELAITSDDFFELVRTVVTIFTQLEAERPIRRHHWQADDCCVLLDDTVGRRTEKYVHVEYTADCAVSDGRQRLQLHLCIAATHNLMLSNTIFMSLTYGTR